MYRKKLLKYILIFFTISAILYLISKQVNQEQIIKLVQSTGIFGPLTYTILYSSTSIIAPLSGTPIFLAGYILFKSEFLIYSYISVVATSVINFWIARKFGRKTIIKIVGEKNIEKVDQFTKYHGVKSLIFLRIFVGHLGDFVSYAYGLTNIRFLPYIIISTLTPLPGTLIMQFYLLDKVNNIFEFSVIYGIVMIPFIIISILFLAKLKKKS